MVVIDFKVETSDELDVMLLCEETAILGIVAAVEIIIPPGTLTDTRLAVVATLTRGQASKAILIMAVDSQYIPVIEVVGRVIVILSTEEKPRQGACFQRQLLIDTVTLVAVDTTILHLDRLITRDEIPVDVTHRVSRPAASNIMEEEARHIAWAGVFFT